MLEPRQLKAQHYCQLSSLSMEMGRTAKNTDSGCNLYSVTTGWMLFMCLLSFGVKDYEDHGTILLCQTEESATLYKHCNRIWPFSFEDWWHIKTNTIATRVESLQ